MKRKWTPWPGLACRAAPTLSRVSSSCAPASILHQSSLLQELTVQTSSATLASPARHHGLSSGMSLSPSDAADGKLTASAARDRFSPSKLTAFSSRSASRKSSIARSSRGRSSSSASPSASTSSSRSSRSASTAFCRRPSRPPSSPRRFPRTPLTSRRRTAAPRRSSASSAASGPRSKTLPLSTLMSSPSCGR